MIHTEDGYRGMQFESVILPDADGSYTTRLFAVEGKPGIWKRVTKKQSDDINFAIDHSEITAARFKGSIIQLVRAKEIEAELAEAGFHLPQVQQERVEADQAPQVRPLEVELPHRKRLHA